MKGLRPAHAASSSSREWMKRSRPSAMPPRRSSPDAGHRPVRSRAVPTGGNRRNRDGHELTRHWMKPAPFEYARPGTLAEALSLLAEDDAKPIAGGQSLVPLLALRMTSP